MNNKGFTLVELIASILILMIISTIIVVNFSSVFSKSDDRKKSEIKRQLEDAACIYVDLSSNKAFRDNSSDCTHTSTQTTCYVSVTRLIEEGLIPDSIKDPADPDIVLSDTSNVYVKYLKNESTGVKTCTGFYKKSGGSFVSR